jgi:hypothetical protein
MNDYRISELQRGWFMVKLPVWITPHRVLQEVTTMSAVLNVYPEHWRNTTSKQIFQPFYWAHITIYSFPIDY